MKTATARDLRIRAFEILDSVRRGDEVIITLRGKSVAVMKPVGDSERPFSYIGFGIWHDHKEMKTHKKWIDDRRKVRYLKRV